MISPFNCIKCKNYWEDLKLCKKFDIYIFEKKFEKIQTDECLSEIEEEYNNLWDNITRRNMYE
jgi:hypothetical protein